MKIVSFIGLALLAVGGCRAVESGSRGDGSESDGAASLETERVIAEAAATRPALKTEITAADIARYRLERPRLLLSKSDVQRVRIDYPGHSRYIEKRCSEARGAALPEDAPVTKPTGQAPAYRSSWSAISGRIPRFAGSIPAIRSSISASRRPRRGATSSRASAASAPNGIMW